MAAQEMTAAELLAEYIKRTGDTLSVSALTEWDHCRHNETLTTAGCGADATYDVEGYASCDEHTVAYLQPLVAPLLEMDRLLPAAAAAKLKVVPTDHGFDSMRQCSLSTCHCVPAYTVDDDMLCLDHTVEILAGLLDEPPPT